MTIKTWQETNGETMEHEIVSSDQICKWMQAEIDELRAAMAQPQGEVYEEAQIGVTGSGGTHKCPDCDGHGYIASSVYRNHPKASDPAPCDAGSVCLNCQPRNADGSCPDAAPKSPEYMRGFADGLKEAPECQCQIKGLGDDSVSPRVYPSEPA